MNADCQSSGLSVGPARPPYRRAAVTALLLAALALVAACARPLEEQQPSADTDSAAAPRFEPGLCWGALPAGVLAQCGYVVVPERYDRAVDATTELRLAVVALRTARTDPTQPPTLFLGGGPGQDVVGLFAAIFAQYQAILDEGFPPERYPGERADAEEFKAVLDLLVADLDRRPFVYFDQRGAGYSRPSLKCHGEPLAQCRARLLAAGVDLAAYTTIASAQDVNCSTTRISIFKLERVASSVPFSTRQAKRSTRAPCRPS